MAADHAQQFEAVQIGRVDIEQDQVYLIVPQLAHRLGTRLGLLEDGESKEAGHTVYLRGSIV